MPIDLTSQTDDELDTLKLDVGDTFVGIVVDVDEAPHYKFGTQEPELTKSGQPKTKWVVRLRPKDATSRDQDVKFWAQNQVKFELRQTLAGHPRNYLGGLLKVERLEDGKPSNPAFKGPHQYAFTLKPGPDAWVDPLAPTEAFDPFGEDGMDDPF